MQVKIPVTEAGIDAIEEATFQGVSVNATVCFTVPRQLELLSNRARSGAAHCQWHVDCRDVSVCTIMIGRTDDWMKVLANRETVDIDPAFLDWLGSPA